MLDRAGYGARRFGALPAAAEFAARFSRISRRGSAVFTDGGLEVNGAAADAAGYAKALEAL